MASMKNIEKCIPAPPLDPNQNQNRVPSQTELNTLRMIRAQQRQMTDTTRRQFDMALEEHDRIQTRHDQLLRDLEATRSELNVSHDYLTKLKAQLDICQSEDNRLTGLLHPIRRCPNDIIVCTFEWVVEIDTRERLEIANVLSQVCKSWRIVALNTSFLWSAIEVSMEDNIDAVKAFMERTRVRLGRSPANVLLYGIGERDPEGMKKLMDYVQLKRFKSMKRLKFTLTTSKDLAKLSHQSLLFAPASVEGVEVETLSQSEQSPDWDCALILDQSPDIKLLELDVNTTVLFGGDRIYSSLLNLSLHNSPAPSLLHHLSKFPRLQELDITGDSNDYEMETPSESINMPQLQLLRVNCVSNFPWNKISTPCLRELSTPNANEDHSPLDFCFRHPSIIDLTYQAWVSENQLKEMANSLSNLEYLDVGGDLRGMYHNVVPDMSFPPFPKLKTLIVDYTGDQHLSLEEFENFVCTRLLPQYPQDDPILKVWKIFVKSVEADLLPWRKSDLLSRLHEAREECAFDEDMHYVVLNIK